MTIAFKQVILYARHHRANHHVNESLARVIACLKNYPVNVFMEQETAHHFPHDLPVFDPNNTTEHTIIIVVGGDGSILSAASLAILIDAPIVGINRGRLGFLTDISPPEIETSLADLLAGKYHEETRFMLKALVKEKSEICYALNDVVLRRDNEASLADFDLYIDDQLVSHYRADGLILATPTGSTAYALSAGGPIMHPALEALVLVPMFSHSLNSRPLVVRSDVSVMLRLDATNEYGLSIRCDGHETLHIAPGEEMLIQKTAQRLRLLHPSDYHYYDTLRMKLRWESKHQE